MSDFKSMVPVFGRKTKSGVLSQECEADAGRNIKKPIFGRKIVKSVYVSNIEQLLYNRNTDKLLFSIKT